MVYRARVEKYFTYSYILLIFSPYEYKTPLKKRIFYIFPYSQKKKHYSIYTTFQYFSLPKVHYFRYSHRFPPIAKTFSAHGLNSFFAGVYLYSLSCGQKTAQNAVTHCETRIFPDSCRAVIIDSNIYILQYFRRQEAGLSV